MAVAFEKTHPNVDVVYTMIPMTNGEYQTKLMATLGTDQVPDVVALEAAFVKSYVESDFLADLGGLLDEAKAADTYPFVHGVLKKGNFLSKVKKTPLGDDPQTNVGLGRHS